MLKGIGASAGIAIGKAFILEEAQIEVVKASIEDVEKEVGRFKTAVEEARTQLQTIASNAREKLGKDKAEIFEAHLFMLEDPDFMGAVEKKIISNKSNAEYALKSTSEEYASIFEMAGNEYMIERAADIRDVSKRILSILLGKKSSSAAEIIEECIIIAKDLTPSETAQIDRKKVLGFITEVGGKTSHSAIIANSLQIPAVVGAGKVTLVINNSDTIIMDGSKGEIFVNPNEEILALYKSKMEEEIKNTEELLKFRDMESITVDGRKVEIAANIGSTLDAEDVINKGGEGIGLFRTEFLYMSKDSLPTEDEQFKSYKDVLEKMQGKPVIIRTLDIGGDKGLPYFNMEKEMNPFLGYRAIRICLDRTDIFKTQLRALFRASVYGNMKIMFPMISSLQELRKAKDIVEEIKIELSNENIDYKNNVKIGMMIEVPSAAIISDVLAKEVDFFSIGTNDLIQYTTAVDRMNEKISALYDFFHPAVLRLIKLVIDNAHKEGKMVGMCGEMAGNPKLIPVLLGMGLDEFSMSASSMLKARKTICSIEHSKTREIADRVLTLESSEEIKKYLSDALLKI